MKRLSLLSLCCVLSTHAFSQNESPLPGVEYSSSDNTTLSVHNLSSDEITIDIYGKNFILQSGSGLAFECESQPYVEIQVKGMVHDYFEVSCPSRVTFTEAFQLTE